MRPLTGEPLALDLANTTWLLEGVWVDAFDDPDGVASWLAEHALPTGPAGPTGPDARASLIEARDAVRAALQGDEGPLNDVLGHGARRPLLRDGEPVEELVIDAPGREAAWIAAADLVRLYAERPERIRECANPECVLWFYDVTKNGQRRWCSMEVCGNRAKAARFQQRHRT
ncbi:CGNR zinc finger domain-containing protein [Spirillospora sp. NPDC047279]|uniref:CGNR zinc finger domain-containing protein n=1 Tax=Spirillospora sp. NPDC047279 TaxID=3155478 RepID=UPI0033F179D7